MNLSAAAIQARVQIPLLAPRNVAAILGLILIEAVLFASELGVIMGGLLRINLAV
jgi:hypothetical protein